VLVLAVLQRKPRGKGPGRRVAPPRHQKAPNDYLLIENAAEELDKHIAVSATADALGAVYTRSDILIRADDSGADVLIRAYDSRADVLVG
jgi:hypothetical protein